MSMIDPFQLATQGVGPGFSTFNMATMGFGFEIEVIIQPSRSGGGYFEDIPSEYEVIVRIKYKGKVWEQRKFVSAVVARSLEKVFATFKSVKTQTIEVFSKINNILKREIHINIFRK